MPRAKVLLIDREFSATVREALTLMKSAKPIVIDYEEQEFDIHGERLGQHDYEEFHRNGRS